MPSSIKVLIVDDHEMFCESLAALISMKDDIEVVGLASSGAEAIRKTELLRPDIILMDIKMKGIDGIEAMRKIKEKSPDIDFIMLTMYDDEEYVMESIKAGAKGYVLKESPSSKVLEAIRTVGTGKAFFDPNSSSRVIEGIQRQRGQKGPRPEEDEAILSPREIDILRLMAEGYSNKEISNKLFISPHTTRNHIANIFMKLNCQTRMKAVIEGKRKGLI